MTGSAHGRVCPYCDTPMSPTTTFCPNCGAPVQVTAGGPAAPAAEGPPGSDGQAGTGSSGFHSLLEELGLFSSQDEQHQPPDDFIRRVRLDAMQSNLLGGRSVKVPRGSVAVLFDGTRIVEIVRPGNEITIGLLKRAWDRLRQLGVMTAGTTPQADLFLIDLRPVPIPFTVDIAGPTGLTSKVEVLAEVSVRLDDHGALIRLLSSELLRHESLSTRGLYDALSPRIQKTIQQLLAQYSDGLRTEDFAQLEEQLWRQVQGQIVDPYGLWVTIRLTPLAEMIALDIHLGLAPAPAVKKCVDCGAEIRSTTKFCPSCGASQPAQQMPTRTCPTCGYAVSAGKKFCTSCGHPFEDLAPNQEALFTRDGQQVELDVLARVSGSRADENQPKLEAALASAAAGFLRGYDYASLCNPAGLQAFEQAIKPAVMQAISACGMNLVDVAILDIRSKQGEWVLKARAELEQARKETLMGREWLQTESESLDLKAMTLELALRQRQVELDHDFELDRAGVDDRQRRQDLREATADMDVADAERQAHRDLGIDAAEREVARTRAAEGHADQIDGVRRQHELTATQAGQEMELERQVADHDAGLARQAIGLESERKRLQVDDQIYGRRQERDLDLDTQQRKQDMTLDGEAKRQAMQVEKLRAMADMEARMTAQENEHAEKMRELFKGQSTEEILAMQAQGDEAIAAALAEKFRAQGAASEKTEAMYERLLADRDAKDGQMAGMMQQFMQNMQSTTMAAMQAKHFADDAAGAAQQAKADQVVAMSEKTMGAMSDVAATAAGGVVATRPRPAPPAAAPEPPQSRAKGGGTPNCVSCGSPLEPPFVFCGACGTKQR